MTNATQGRRPEGPGWYWYCGEFAPYPDNPAYGTTIDQPVEVLNANNALVWQYAPVPVRDMPGDFVPLHPPVAAPEPELREALAAVSHAIWAHWMRYLFDVSVKCDGGDNDGCVLILPDHVTRWQRQMQTDYADLSEREKESDRRQADKILAVLPTPVAAPEPDWSKAPKWAKTAHLVLVCGYRNVDLEWYWSSSDGTDEGEENATWDGSRQRFKLTDLFDFRKILSRRPEVSGE